MKHISFNLNDDEDNKKNWILHDVDSFENIEFLILKKRLSENMIDSSKKIESNWIYINQSSYDFDGNANNNKDFEYDFFCSKNINQLCHKKEHTVNMNQIYMEEEDDDIKESDIDKKSNYTYSEARKIKKAKRINKKAIEI